MTRARLTAFAGALALGAATLGLIGPSSAGTTRLCHGHRATIVMAPQADRVVGTNHRDVIVGNAQRQSVIAGRGGDDLICGGRGADMIHGGKGNDHLDGEGAGDSLLGGKGNDHLYGGAGSNALVGGDGDDVGAAGPANRDHANRGQEGPGDDRDVLVGNTLLWFGGPVVVDLAAGTATGQGHDRLVTPNKTTARVVVRAGSRVYGSRYHDFMQGVGSSFYGGSGPDRFRVSGS